MTYRQRLQKATAKAKRANPVLTWQDAKEAAKTYLHNILKVYPCDAALALQFKQWQKDKTTKEAANAEPVATRARLEKGQPG